MVLLIHKFDKLRAVYVEIVFGSISMSCCCHEFFRADGETLYLFLVDNGTIFVGAAREILEWIAAWNQSDIEQSVAQKQIEWNFNPPGAPYFGGVCSRQYLGMNSLLWII